MPASKIHIGEKIHQELLRQNKSVKWFAEQLGCQRPNVYRIFVSHSIDTELLFKISRILQYDFFALYQL